MKPEYLHAEARAYVAHTPGTSLHMVDDVAVVTMGAQLTQEELEWHVRSMAGTPHAAMDERSFAA